MKVSIIVFPGSNCDKDVEKSVTLSLNMKPKLVWYLDDIPDRTDLVIIPGGFSYGDYLRTGAIAAKSNIMSKVIKLSGKGIPLIGICNGFQILTEANLLPGTLVLNNNLKFICKNVFLKITNSKSIFTNSFSINEIIQLPIAHKSGNYRIDNNNFKELIDNNQIVMRYSSQSGICKDEFNPNGSIYNIAGIINKKGNILGMMPHPERHYSNKNVDIYMRKILKSILF